MCVCVFHDLSSELSGLGRSGKTSPAGLAGERDLTCLESLAGLARKVGVGWQAGLGWAGLGGRWVRWGWVDEVDEVDGSFWLHDITLQPRSWSRTRERVCGHGRTTEDALGDGRDGMGWDGHDLGSQVSLHVSRGVIMQVIICPLGGRMLACKNSFVNLYGTAYIWMVLAEGGGWSTKSKEVTGDLTDSSHCLCWAGTKKNSLDIAHDHRTPDRARLGHSRPSLPSPGVGSGLLSCYHWPRVYTDGDPTTGGLSSLPS